MLEYIKLLTTKNKIKFTEEPILNASYLWSELLTVTTPKEGKRTIYEYWNYE